MHNQSDHASNPAPGKHNESNLKGPGPRQAQATNAPQPQVTQGKYHCTATAAPLHTFCMIHAGPGQQFEDPLARVLAQCLCSNSISMLIRLKQLAARRLSSQNSCCSAVRTLHAGLTSTFPTLVVTTRCCQQYQLALGLLSYAVRPPPAAAAAAPLSGNDSSFH